MSADDDAKPDTELRELIQEAVSHAVERRASLKHKEEMLLDMLISNTSPTSPTASKTSSEAAPALPASKSLTAPTPLSEIIRHNHPHLTDEEVEEWMDVT